MNGKLIYSLFADLTLMFSIKGNPTPTFEWRLDGRFMGNGKTLEAKVSEKDDRKVLECTAIHQPLKGATQRVKTTSQIRVECKSKELCFRLNSKVQ